ncbi:MAG: hypothetical protein RLZ98_1896 [Pseudomonadota bacterium]|jgi:hypothetical protein
MDIKAIIDGIIATFQQLAAGFQQASAAPSGQPATVQAEQAGNFYSSQSLILFALLAAVALWAYSRRKEIARRTRTSFAETLFGNWQLALLGATGVILSIASGWTTWDGMRNFTGEPILSLMITFGIQGVMLIVAWLIGESFATGMNQTVRTSGGQSLSRAAQTIIGSILGILFAVAAITLAVSWSGVTSTPGISFADPGSWASSDRLLFLALGIIIVASVLLFQNDVIRPYLQGGTVMLRNMVLWVMFLACMATSVFFSFDSLFSAIFPQDERKRAADIRSINQVSGVVADIGALIQTRRIEEAKKLFQQGSGWENYESQLDAVERLGRLAPDAVREQMEKELQARQQRLAELEEKRASAKGGEVGLASRKVQITDELSRLESQRPEAQTATNQQKAVVTEIEKRLDEQKAKVFAEEKGVEGSGKVGRGKFWRAAKEEETKIRSELQVARQRLDSHAARLDTIVSRIAAIKREQAEIDGEIAKYKGEAQTVNQMIEVARSDKAGEPALQSNPIALVAQLRRDRDAFRLDPQEQTLARIQDQCQLLVTTSSKVASLRNDAAAVDCDPKNASQAAAVVFALNAGAAAYAANCAGGDKLPEKGGTDALLGFGRKCLQDSGLPSRDTSAMGARLASIDLSRDDKAHRFVVTWNAFTDGNRLAYLALAIAIAIDSLVFMSGLFGANAVRSPLSDVPTSKARSARQLEAIVDTALMPHKFETARTVLAAMKPMTQRDGFMARVTLHRDDPHAPDIHRVLNAGTTIGAVRHAEDSDQIYEVRAELFEYLSHVAKREFEANKEHASLADLERVVTVALLPEVHQNVEIVLDHMHPIEDNPTLIQRLGLAPDHGFVSEINLGEIDDLYEKKIVRSVLNAGATANAVQRAESKHYYVHRDLYKTLVRIRARTVLGGPGQLRLSAPAANRGRLQAMNPVIASAPEQLRLSTPSAPPAASGQSAQMKPLPPAPHTPADGEDAGARLERFRGLFLNALGVSPEVFSEITGETYDAAVGASEAFRAVQNTNPTFDALVREREADAIAALDRAYDFALKTIDEQDTFGERLLRDAYSEVISLLAVVSLLPNGPFAKLIDELVAELEPSSGAGQLKDADEADLLRLSRDLQRALRGNPRSDRDSWNRLHLELARTPPGFSSSEDDGNLGKRSLN